jgi:DNA polymerase-3 subunit epsilon
MLRRSPDWTEVVYWALDLETGGLSPDRDPILAVGMVPIRDGVIRLAEAYGTIVRPPPDYSLPNSAAVATHHIMPGEAAKGPHLREVLPQVDRRLREGVLLVHHARIDVTFLKRAYRAMRQLWPRPKIVDTVSLIWKLASRERFLGEGTASRGDPPLRLGDARAAIGLPSYPAHDALSDATATAELFLALRARLGARTLRELV